MNWNKPVLLVLWCLSSGMHGYIRQCITRGRFSQRFGTRGTGTKRIPVSVFCRESAFRAIHKQPVQDSPRLTTLSSNRKSSIGEDAAYFSFREQKLGDWTKFSVAVGGMLGFLFYVWIYNGGPQLGTTFVRLCEDMAGEDSTGAIVYMLGIFAVAHSGLASLRPKGEEIIGPRAWRVIFAAVSLPLAFSCIAYFINHRYDGVHLWNLENYLSRETIHNGVWWSSLVSFLFLYPSTFNLLEIAAIENPQLHLWETGVTRITRHPQAAGQILWCAAHTAYIGTSFTAAASFMLCVYHLFACWNGDRRLKDKFGDQFEQVKEVTSIIPFAAILTGKQQLPSDYLQEWLRPPYAVVVVGTLVAYFSHPFMQSGAYLTGW